MIGIIGSTTDLHARTVIEKLEQKKASYKLIDTKEFPYGWQSSVKIEGGAMANKIGNFDLSEIRSFWFRRRYDFKISSQIDPAYENFLRAEYQSFLSSLAMVRQDAFWMSRPQKVILASGKPFNLQQALKCGFKIPATYIGNNLYEIFDFVSPTKEYALKAAQSGFISAKPYEDGTMAHSLYTQKVLGFYVLDRVENLAICPVTIQEYIPKAFELRITVVGNRIFPAKIESQRSPNIKTNTDWRHYDLDNTPHSEFVLPEEIEKKCFELVQVLGLQYGCIDMIVTPSNEYYYLEINPNGQWLWIENLTNMPISDAIADLLIDPQTNMLK